MSAEYEELKKACEKGEPETVDRLLGKMQEQQMDLVTEQQLELIQVAIDKGNFLLLWQLVLHNLFQGVYSNPYFFYEVTRDSFIETIPDKHQQNFLKRIRKIKSNEFLSTQEEKKLIMEAYEEMKRQIPQNPYGTSLGDMPPEVMQTILQNVSSKKRAELSTTAKVFADTAKDINEEYRKKYEQEFPYAYENESSYVEHNKTTLNWQERYNNTAEEAYKRFSSVKRELFRQVKQRPFDFDACKSAIQKVAAKCAALDEHKRETFLRNQFLKVARPDGVNLLNWIWEKRQSSGIAKDLLNEIFHAIIYPFVKDDPNQLVLWMMHCHQPLDEIERAAKKSNLNQLLTTGKTLLMEACVIGDENLVRLLLQMGADENVTTAKGHTAFYFACKYGNDQNTVTKIFVEKMSQEQLLGAFDIACDFHSESLAQQIFEKSEHHEQFMSTACHYGHTEIVRKILDEGFDLEGEEGNDLVIQATSGNSKTMQLLLEHGAPANATTPDGRTALMTSMRRGQIDIAKTLIEHGADVQLALSGLEGHAYAIQRLIELCTPINVAIKAEIESCRKILQKLAAEFPDLHKDIMKNFDAASGDPALKAKDLQAIVDVILRRGSHEDLKKEIDAKSSVVKLLFSIPYHNEENKNYYDDLVKEPLSSPVATRMMKR